MEGIATGSVLFKTPLNVGINQSWKAIVRCFDGDTAAIIKQLPEREIQVECLCALLGRLINLPIPRPLLVIDQELGVLFGSEELPHPDLKHALLPTPYLLHLLNNWQLLTEAAIFDEWIVNPDRHGGNLLTDGEGEFWLIDHGLALAANAEADEKLTPNYLFNILTESADSSKRLRLVQSLGRHLKLITPDVTTELYHLDQSMLEFLQKRQQWLYPLLRSAVLNHDELPGI